ncbi:O-methyltransferase [Mucilaginibacter terrae]|uniref:O-methyltransferase n=1 Tax=Mucilaginibacter terrae TaxID=1955052 RepID=UPI00363B6642
MGAGATIPYHLRPHKAIERNIFIKTLKMLERWPNINLTDYRYVGFGAAFLEDFKIMHSEFGITNMDSIEMDKCAFTRQVFNKPYQFVDLFPVSSSDYIKSGDFKSDKNQIIWLDYADRGYEYQLQDLEALGSKVDELDVIKITFNCQSDRFTNYNQVYNKFTTNETLKTYAPPNLQRSDLSQDFASVLRVMAIRALQRGISNGRKQLIYTNITAFEYADGAMMTTMTGIITKANEFDDILELSGLDNFPFLSLQEVTTWKTKSYSIQVPVMTVPERIEVDKKLTVFDSKTIASGLQFKYGSEEDNGENNAHHEHLIDGYVKFYSYLPYYSRVTI